MNQDLWRRLIEEWLTVSAAPYFHWLLFLTVLAMATCLAHLWNRKELLVMRAWSELTKAQLGELKTENAQLLRVVSGLTNEPALAAFEYGSEALEQAFLEISKPGHKVTFRGGPQDWTPERIRKFAAFMRLQDMGYAEIKERTMLSVNVVSGTSAALNYHEIATTPDSPLPLNADEAGVSFLAFATAGRSAGTPGTLQPQVHQHQAPIAERR